MGTEESEREPTDQQALYRLPAQCRELLDGFVRAGIADDAEGFWTSMFGPKRTGPEHGPSVLEAIVEGIIRAHPPAPTDTRSAGQRSRAAMNALLGDYYRDGENDRDDRDLLSQMAWELNTGPKIGVREAARRALAELEGKTAAENESYVRRLTRKYNYAPGAAIKLAQTSDDFRLIFQGVLIEAVAELLRSAGTPIRFPETRVESPQPVNGEVGYSLSSDQDEIPV